MSHYSVAVLTKEGQSIEDLLSPFDESINVDPYISRTKAEIIQDVKERKGRLINQLKKDPDMELCDILRQLLVCETDEDFYNYYFCEDDLYDDDGNELSTYNPNAKWDWYSIGGRFSRLITMENGERTNSCKIKDADFSYVDRESYDEALRFWEVVIDGKPLEKGEKQPFSLYKKEYYIERYGTKEEFAKSSSNFGTYAILTPDGVWHEPGKMGWFGVSHATIEAEREWEKHYQEILNTANPEWTITIVDCHI